MQAFTGYIHEGINLTLEYHDELNPLIWEDEDMKSKVRERLLQIGRMWADFAKIPQDAIRDIVLTGGNANYNYTPYSDLDVHLLVNLSKIPGDKETLTDRLYDKKVLWTYKHPHLTVMGYPVELYAQDYRQAVATEQGEYSLMKGRWLTKPNILSHPDFDNDKALLDKIEEYKEMIERILSEPGDHTGEIKKLKEKFHNMRSAGIQRAGEFSMENLMYKELRNRGYIDRLNDYLQKKHDELLSLTA
jgi:hypothetical protein